MATEKTNKKTVEEGKNIKAKKSNPAAKKEATSSKSNKTKPTNERSDVNSDVDQE